MATTERQDLGAAHDLDRFVGFLDAPLHRDGKAICPIRPARLTATIGGATPPEPGGLDGTCSFN